MQQNKCTMIMPLNYMFRAGPVTTVTNLSQENKKEGILPMETERVHLAYLHKEDEIRSSWLVVNVNQEHK